MAFTLSLGQKAPDFDLPGVDGKNHSLSSFKDAKLLVVVFSCNHCPFVVGSEDRMKRFVADFDLPGVDGKNHSLSSFKDAKLLVVVFSCNHCPFVVGSEDRMKRFVADF